MRTNEGIEQQPTTTLHAGPGVLVVVSGPSGVGKDTILQALFAKDPGLHFSVSYTTRRPREGEQDGVSYSFVTPERFWEHAASGELLEWAYIHGNWYGSSKSRIEGYLSRGEDVVLKIDVQGAASIRPRVTGNALFLFIAPPSYTELERRLVDRRTETAEDLELRLKNAKEEMDRARMYDAVIINDDIDKAVSAIHTMIQQHRTPSTSAPTQ